MMIMIVYLAQMSLIIVLFVHHSIDALNVKMVISLISTRHFVWRNLIIVQDINLRIIKMTV